MHCVQVWPLNVFSHEIWEYQLLCRINSIACSWKASHQNVSAGGSWDDLFLYRSNYIVRIWNAFLQNVSTYVSSERQLSWVSDCIVNKQKASRHRVPSCAVWGWTTLCLWSRIESSCGFFPHHSQSSLKVLPNCPYFILILVSARLKYNWKEKCTLRSIDPKKVKVFAIRASENHICLPIT